jgi:hypothetical protein
MENLIEIAKQNTRKDKVNKNIGCSEELNLAIAYLHGEVSVRGVLIALGRKPNPNSFYPWIIAQMKYGIRSGELRYLKPKE